LRERGKGVGKKKGELRRAIFQGARKGIAALSTTIGGKGGIWSPIRSKGKEFRRKQEAASVESSGKRGDRKKVSDTDGVVAQDSGGNKNKEPGGSRTHSHKKRTGSTKGSRGSAGRRNGGEGAARKSRGLQ